MVEYEIRPIVNSDRGWISGFIGSEWGSPIIVTRGNLHDCTELPGYIAERNEEILGLILYEIEKESCEMISLNTLKKGIGVGTDLINRLKDHLRSIGCKRLWLVTTNDNLAAQEFYRKRGFILRSIYPDSIAGSRQLKPEIPELGCNGIPIRDEIEFELLL
jgi:ribosomal protein S18 acetylase RimI-like enzyme